MFLDPVPKAAVPALLPYFDALYMGFQNQPLYRFGVSPNKLMDYMMAAKPIVLAVNAGNDPVAESECGFSIPPENPQALAGAVRRLMAMSPKELSAMGARGNAFVKLNHDYNRLAQQFLEYVE